MTVLARPSITVSTRPGVQARKVRNGLATALIIAAFLIAVVPLVAVIAWVIQTGSSVLSWNFLTKDPPIIDQLPGGGMAPAIVGTLVITAGAALLAIPLGILGGIYLNEYSGNGPLGRLVRFLTEVMTGIPSIVMGLFIYTFWVLHFKENGSTGFAGSLALAALMLPIVIRVTDEMLRLVPDELREGGYALGARRSRTIRTVVLPHALPGVTSGSLLAVARAAGETAPLLFTIGITSKVNVNLFRGTNTALSQQIFRNAQSPFVGARDRAFGAALALIAIVFAFTVLSRIVLAWYARRTSGT